jgi:hypothetical protein
VREALPLSGLRHTNIARLIGISSISGRPVLVFPWYDNGTAQKYLSDKDVSAKLPVVSVDRILQGSNLIFYLCSDTRYCSWSRIHASKGSGSR